MFRDPLYYCNLYVVFYRDVDNFKIAKCGFYMGELFSSASTAWTHHQMLWVPTTSLPRANRYEHKHEWMLKIMKMTVNMRLTETLARTTPANVGSQPHLKPHHPLASRDVSEDHSTNEP